MYGLDCLHNAVNDYYQYNPDTLMPLLLLTLASQGRLHVGYDVNQGSTSFASIEIDEVFSYEWVRLNPVLKKQFKALQLSGVNTIVAYGEVPDELADIYDTFYKYDNETVVQEYHHRMGILTDHSSNAQCEKALRQYASILLSQEMCAAPEGYLQKNFIPEANRLLVKSGLQPKRPRIRVAQALCALLSYDGKGVVYNPFAGCAIAGAMIGAGSNLYADGDIYDKLTAVARLLCYGSGQRGYHIKRWDSTKWLTDVKADYVLSTFLGYPEGKSAFDFCLGKCLNEFSGKGKYAGIIAPKDIFENYSSEMKEALKRDWIDSIVLLPFGEVAILVDAAKSADRKRKIRFYNLTHPMLRRRPIMMMIGNDDYADILKLSDVKKRGYLKSLVIPEIEQHDGCKIVTLGDYFGKVSRQTWSLSRVAAEDRVLAKIDRTKPYDEWQYPWMLSIVKEPISNLFAPSYKLDEDCLIVNCRGNLEPRFFEADQGRAFFQGGFAFKKKTDSEDIDFVWLIHELCRPYVARQLHPYGEDEMLPEAFTEDQVLQIKLNMPVGADEEEEDQDEDLDDGVLKDGTVLNGDKTEYTIHEFLGHGSFGYAYTALANNLATGKQDNVVLKEFFPCSDFHREDMYKAVQNEDTHFDIEAEREKFREEARLMHKLGKIHNSHIVPAGEVFYCEKTDTLYYTMPFYKAGSLQDLQNSDFNFSEEVIIRQILKPLCRALYVAHGNMTLHLDIKPENILVDEYGDAILTDFGTSKQYDSEGMVLNRSGVHGRSRGFAAPEVRGDLTDEGTMVKFAPQPDIYSLAATIYNLVTGLYAHEIKFNSDQDEDLREKMKGAGCSGQFMDAIIAGLQDSAASRPSDAQAFLRLFPGCEKIKL